MDRIERLDPSAQADALNKFPEWVREQQITEVARVLFEIPEQPDIDAFSKFVIESVAPKVEVRLLDPSTAVHIDTGKLVVMGLYPSGAVRTVGNECKVSGADILLTFFDCLSLIDPNDEDFKPEAGKKTCLSLLIVVLSVVC